MRIIRHVASGREYELRSDQAAKRWEAATFDEGKHIRCHVSFNDADDIRGVFGDAIGALINRAESELNEGIVKP